MNSAQKVIELCWPGSKSKPGDMDTLAFRETPGGHWMLFSFDDRIDVFQAVEALIKQPKPEDPIARDPVEEYGGWLIETLGVGSACLMVSGKHAVTISEAPPYARAKALLKVYEKREAA